MVDVFGPTNGQMVSSYGEANYVSISESVHYWEVIPDNGPHAGSEFKADTQAMAAFALATGDYSSLELLA